MRVDSGPLGPQPRFRRARTSSSEATISETTRPAPKRCAIRRKTHVGHAGERREDRASAATATEPIDQPASPIFCIKHHSAQEIANRVRIASCPIHVDQRHCRQLPCGFRPAYQGGWMRVRSSMSVAAIIVAAGRGLRAGGGLPKQYPVGRRRASPRPARSMRFLSAPGDRLGRRRHPPETTGRLTTNAVPHVDWRCREKLLPPVSGGETRQDSVRDRARGPARIAAGHRARPRCRPALRERRLDRPRHRGRPTVRRRRPRHPGGGHDQVVDEDDRVVETPERVKASGRPDAAGLPLHQASRRPSARCSASLDRFTDDGALVEWAGLPVHVFPGDPANVKLTHPADFERAERRLRPVARSARHAARHRLRRPCLRRRRPCLARRRRDRRTTGVVAHSDGDVILHALTDALLGALADGDIGDPLPAERPAMARRLVRPLPRLRRRPRARARRQHRPSRRRRCSARRRGSAPHREAMRSRIAAIAGIAIAHVSLKATTTEKLGFTGRGEGLAAQAAATIRLPEDAA